MKRFVLPLVLLATSQLASAGIVLVEEVDQSGGAAPGKTEMVITASGSQVRVDVGKEMSSIVDSKTGTVTSLLHAQKIAMQLPEGMLDSIKKAAKDQKSKPDLKPTGKQETINGFHCEEYIGTVEGLKVSYWVTSEVKDGKEILEQLSKLAGNDPFKGALANGGDFPGFPMRTVLKTPDMGKSTMSVISIKNEDVPDSTFTIPSGYKMMSMPKMQMPGGGAPAIPASPDAR